MSGENTAHLSVPSPSGLREAVDAERPWPGLAAFREEDRAFFHGREAEIEELHRLVRRERLSLLFGLSGLGKTSLLRAGVFPRLRDEQILPVYVRLDYAAGSPSLAAQTLAAVTRDAAPAGVDAPIARDGETLWEYFHRQDCEFWSPRNRLLTPLLVFDQFEEIFTLGRGTADRSADTRAFLTELADLVEGRPPLPVKARLDAAPGEARGYVFTRHPYRVLVSLREDFLPELEALRDQLRGLLHNRLRLRPMDGDDAWRALRQAASTLLDEGVASQVIRFVAGFADSDARPLGELEVEPALLSLVCHELNEKRLERGERRITTDLLEGSQTEILRDFYERSLADVTPAVRVFVEDRLLTSSGFRDSVAVESAVTTSGVTAADIARLVDRRLLRLELRAGVPRLELTHDVLCGVVRASRDHRREREAQTRAEAAQRQAERRARLARRKLRKTRRTAALLLTLLDWGLTAQRRAERALANAELSEALRLVGRDRAAQALAHLARAARLDPDDLAARSLIVDLLLRRSWPVLLTEVRHERPRSSVSGQSGSEMDPWILSAEFSPDGGKLLTASVEGAAQVWDARTGRALTPPLRHQDRSDAAQPITEDSRLIRLNSACFSPDGARVLTAGWDQAARLWDAATGQSLGPPLRHRFGDPTLRHRGAALSVWAARFSPDGSRIVTAGGDGTAVVWDAQTGQVVGEPLRHEDEVLWASFSPHGTHVVTGSRDGTARLWDAETGRAAGNVLRHDRRVLWAQFSPDGGRVVTTSRDRTARIWDTDTGHPLGEILRHDAAVGHADFSPDGTRVVTASDDHTARLWVAATGQPLGEPMRHEGRVRSARFSPDSSRIVTASEDGTARVWEAETGRALSEPMRHNAGLRSARFSPDGARVATAAQDRAARVWDIQPGRAVELTMRHPSGVKFAVFTPDGSRVLARSAVGGLRVWDAHTGEAVWRPATPSSVGEWGMETHRDPWAVQVNRDGTRVVTIAVDRTARIADPRTGKVLGEPLLGVLSANFSEDGTRIAVAAADRTVQIWDAATGSPLGDPISYDHDLLAVRFSPDATHVAVMSADNAVRLWNVLTRRLIGSPMRHAVPVVKGQFARDGARLATVGADGAVRVWNVRTGDPLGAPMVHSRRVSLVEFSPDGSRLITVAINGVRVWEAATSRLIGETEGHETDICDAHVSPDGARVVTASEDGTARVWDAEMGRALSEPLRHNAGLRSARFSPDGARVVTTSIDRTARLWDAVTGRSLGEPLLHEGTVHVAGFSPDGTRVVTASEDHTVRVWDVFATSRGDVTLLGSLAEAVGGYVVTERGVPLLTRDLGQRLAALRQEAEPTADLLLHAFVRWFLADRATRTISPLARLTVPEFIQRQLAEATPESLREAARVFPGHPLLAEARDEATAPGGAHPPDTLRVGRYRLLEGEPPAPE